MRRKERVARERVAMVDTARTRERRGRGMEALGIELCCSWTRLKEQGTLILAFVQQGLGTDSEGLMTEAEQ